MITMIFILVLIVIVGFMVFAGKKKAKGDDLGETGSSADYRNPHNTGA